MSHWLITAVLTTSLALTVTAAMTATVVFALKEWLVNR